MTITIENLVEREVYYNVSYLVSELAQMPQEFNEELLEVMSKYDYETPARDFIYTMGAEQIIEYLEEQGHYDGETTREKELRDDLLAMLDENDSWQDFCEDFNIEEQIDEALQHWIVSDWLADKLAERGEMVLKDFMGLTIWGRTTCGQAIAQDYVIQQIYADLTGKEAA